MKGAKEGKLIIFLWPLLQQLFSLSKRFYRIDIILHHTCASVSVVKNHQGLRDARSSSRLTFDDVFSHLFPAL